MGFVIPTQRIASPTPHRDLVHDHDWFVQINERATPDDWPTEVLAEVAREIADAALPSPEAATFDYRFPLDNSERDAEICARYAAGGVKHSDLADVYGVTPTRIGQILRSAGVKGAPHVRNAERDTEMYRRYTEERVTPAELAAEYGISGPRVSQIITAEHNRRVSS